MPRCATPFSISVSKSGAASLDSACCTVLLSDYRLQHCTRLLLRCMRSSGSSRYSAPPTSPHPEITREMSDCRLKLRQRGWVTFDRAFSSLICPVCPKKDAAFVQSANDSRLKLGGIDEIVRSLYNRVAITNPSVITAYFANGPSPGLDCCQHTLQTNS